MSVRSFLTTVLVLAGAACGESSGSGTGHDLVFPPTVGPGPAPAGGPDLAVPASLVCDGSACGGTSDVPFLYRVIPGSMPISAVEVGVEDGDVRNYALLRAPDGWEPSIVAAPRAHAVRPSRHGEATSEAGACPFVLLFAPRASGTPQDAAFELGYSYSLAGQFHDVHWSASDGAQARWTFPVGSDGGPAHSPLRPNVILIVLDDVGTDR